MIEPTTICLTGGDGSGKSTQIAGLRDVLITREISVGVVSIWDAFADPEVGAQMPVKDPSDIYGYLRLLGPNSRPLFLFHALHLALERAQTRHPSVLLLDGYWYKYFAAEVAHGADPAALRDLVASFPEPDVTFHLSISAEEALLRKSRRSDYEGGFTTDPREFVRFQSRTRGVLETLARELHWINVDAELPPAEITGLLVHQMEKGQGCAD